METVLKKIKVLFLIKKIQHWIIFADLYTCENINHLHTQYYYLKNLPILIIRLNLKTMNVNYVKY